MMKMTELSKPLTVAVDDLIFDIKTDYINWYRQAMKSMSPDMTEEDFILKSKKFLHSIRIEEGKKYIKIYTGNSIWGFVVKEDNTVKCLKSGNYFICGDILKADSYVSPARNYSRGNVRLGVNLNLERDFTYSTDNYVSTEYPNYKIKWEGAI